MDKLVEMQGGLRLAKDMAVHVHELEVGQDPHWVYHRDYTTCDLDPIPG